MRNEDSIEWLVRLVGIVVMAAVLGLVVHYLVSTALNFFLQSLRSLS